MPQCDLKTDAISITLARQGKGTERRRRCVPAVSWFFEPGSAFKHRNHNTRKIRWTLRVAMCIAVVMLIACSLLGEDRDAEDPVQRWTPVPLASVGELTVRGAAVIANPSDLRQIPASQTVHAMLSVLTSTQTDGAVLRRVKIDTDRISLHGVDQIIVEYEIAVDVDPSDLMDRIAALTGVERVVSIDLNRPTLRTTVQIVSLALGE